MIQILSIAFMEQMLIYFSLVYQHMILTSISSESWLFRQLILRNWKRNKISFCRDKSPKKSHSVLKNTSLLSFSLYSCPFIGNLLIWNSMILSFHLLTILKELLMILFYCVSSLEMILCLPYQDLESDKVELIVYSIFIRKCYLLWMAT